MKFLEDNSAMIIGFSIGFIIVQSFSNEPINAMEVIGFSLICTGIFVFFRSWSK